MEFSNRLLTQRARPDGFGTILRFAAGVGVGMGVGATAAYFFDPSRGKRRRTLAAGRVASAVSCGARALETRGRDLKEKLCGWAVETKSFVHDSKGAVSEEVTSTRSPYSGPERDGQSLAVF